MENTMHLPEGIEKTVDNILADKQSSCGRRFSTYHEGHAKTLAQFDNAMDAIRSAAGAVDLMWHKVKDNETDAAYEQALNTAYGNAGVAVVCLLNMMAELKKLSAGVVHEPKPTGEAMKGEDKDVH